MRRRANSANWGCAGALRYAVWSCPKSMSFGNSTNGSALNWRASSLAAAGAGLALCAAACGGRHSAATPGTEEQVLNIYNWADYVGYHTIAEFERQTHIKVVYELYDSNQTLEAKMLAGRSGYDIVSTTTAFYGRQIKPGTYTPLHPSKLPNWRNLDPAVLTIQSHAGPRK